LGGGGLVRDTTFDGAIEREIFGYEVPSQCQPNEKEKKVRSSEWQCIEWVKSGILMAIKVPR
jgi:hypothetical protein